MSLDRSLKTASSLSRHRNVLTRAERVAKLAERGKFDLSDSDPLHLPKVGNRKIGGGKAVKKEVEGEEGAKPAAGKAAAKAPAGKAPAAKAAAPAAKPAAKK